MSNIFDEVTPESGEFFKFLNIGDAIQGTYIGRKENINKFGAAQNIYLIKDSDGKVWNVAFVKTSLVPNERMAGIKFGQIVGFRFDEERPSKVAPGTKAKIIRIYADNKFIDHEWIARQKELDSSFDGTPSTSSTVGTVAEEESEVDKAMKSVFEAPANATPATSNVPEAKPNLDPMDAIRSLAKTKGLTHDEMAWQEENEAIEKYTGLKMEEANLTKIIIALTGFTKK